MRCACKTASYGCFGKNSCHPLFERQHGSTEHFDETEGVGEDGTLEVCSDHDGRLLFFHGMGHVSESMADGRPHAMMQWKKNSRIEAVMQVETRAWGALSKFIRLSSVQTAYSL